MYFFIAVLISCANSSVERISGAGALGYDFRKIGDGGELRQQAVQQRKTVLPDRWIWIVYKNLIEEQLDLRPERGDGCQLPAIRRGRSGCFARAQKRVVKLLVRSCREQARVGLVGLFDARLRQYVLDAFEARGQRFEIFRGPDVVDGVGSLGQIGKR